MPGNVQKTPFVQSFQRAVKGAGLTLEQLQGRAMPATLVSLDSTGTIATVNLELDSIFTLPPVTCPVGFPQYVRFPLPKGTPGVVLSSDYYMGGMSGLGGGVAKTSRLANLASCIWWPVGNTDFTPTPNPNAGVLYGPDGAILTNQNRDPLTVKVVVDGENNVMIYGARSVSTDVHGYGERLTWRGGASFDHETWHDGATVNEIELGYHPPEIPPPT